METCFFSGMDTYQKIWLQFAFPLYIWLLVGVIIVASHYSSRMVKIFGKNNISILATLFFFSYTKILRIIIIALSFTGGFRGSADDVRNPLVPYTVWTYDGNIEFLNGKHVVLFTTVVLVLIFLLLPYTLLLIFGQLVRSISTEKTFILRCIRSTVFVSIMDAYHAPYNTRHRYWTGLMLLTRIVLFLALASNSNVGAILENMYIIAVVIITIFLLKMTFSHNIYTNSYIDTLELSFFVNLMFLSSTLHFLIASGNHGSKICAVISTSIAVSMIVFTCIVAYHVYLKINKTRWFTSIAVIAKWPFTSAKPADSAQGRNLPPDNQQKLQTSGLRESILAN